ncbi:unnamed protein product [Caenorhabditis sp. 36 PRJEB53466]|nr:unnamed protein product [Caenorhabditis sp. 36 PRJEB53466]
MSIAEQLVSMGFSGEQAAIAAANDRNLQQALDFIIEKDSAASQILEAEAPEPEPVVVASSFKCNECGKQLANDDAVMWHASKTKHANYSQSTETVLSREQKEAQIAEIIEKIKENNEKRAEVEEAEMTEKETKRRADELRAAAEQRRQQKKRDEAERQRILEQIRQDREERKAGSSGIRPPQKKLAVVVPTNRDYTQAIIRVRGIDGHMVKRTFGAEEQLSCVHTWIQTAHPQPLPYALMTPFPRKVFEESEMEKTLKDLDLVPSANIVLVRRASEATPAV